jgi:hypothetical protein
MIVLKPSRKTGWSSTLKMRIGWLPILKTRSGDGQELVLDHGGRRAKPVLTPSRR